MPSTSRRNKTFERGAKRCSDCEAALEARQPRPVPPAVDGAPRLRRPASSRPVRCWGSESSCSCSGGLVIWGNPDGGGGGFAAGVLLAWAGGLVLLVALIAFGVRIGIQAAAADDVAR